MFDFEKLDIYQVLRELNHKVFVFLNNHPEIVKILLDRGADTKLKDKEYGYSALDFAVEIGHPEVVEILKEANK